ncbi:hypothetical protein Y032_0049g1872 [Ancylostoma ceylanicum]|uniref:Uncharacterized protein n=1 Tax=Ancylostoma ceylanicum TaxID=53326 RepID=A0A016UBH5_9BILA|nr:hypothetical protein Y032_0049g1872 [Ancylostoma ceylanicum]
MTFSLHFASAVCYHCFSSDASLEPKVRTHLGTQEDVFFMPITSRTSSCSDKIESDYTAIEGQICSSSPLCVTLTPNIANSTFVVRGCMEYILRHSLKKEDIHKEGCYLVRSLPARFPNNFTMEYVLCVCKGDYCNGEQPPDFLPGPHAFHGEMVLPLTPKEDIVIAPGRRAQLEISSSAFVFILFPWIFSFSLMTILIS